MMKHYWVIDEGDIDSAAFFSLLWKYFPDATTLFVEGTRIDKEVQRCCQDHLEEGPFLPGRQALFPTSKTYRCRLSRELLDRLAVLSQTREEPEDLLDHLFLYKGSEPVLEWHDAFANTMLLSRAVPQSVVSDFAAELGLAYGETKFG
jgi:hypothetical protein